MTSEKAVEQIVAGMSTEMLKATLSKLFELRKLAQTIGHNDAAATWWFEIGIAAGEAEMRRRFPVP
jgi:pyruvoyl-dependent arginine decarboxylase (PvlArgDC)